MYVLFRQLGAKGLEARHCPRPEKVPAGQDERQVLLYRLKFKLQAIHTWALLYTHTWQFGIEEMHPKYYAVGLFGMHE